VRVFPNGAVEHLTFSPDGALLAGCGSGPKLRMFDPFAGRPLWSEAARRRFSIRFPVVFAPDGLLVALQRYPDAVFDARTGQRLADPAWHPLPIEGPDGYYEVRFHSPDGRWEARYGFGYIDLFDVPAGRPFAGPHAKSGVRLPGDNEWGAHLRPACFSPDSARLVALRRAHLFVLRLPTCEVEAELAPPSKRTRAELHSAAFTPDGRRLLVVGHDAAVREWDATSWALRREYAWGVGPLKSVAVAPDGLRAAAAGKRIVVWDLDD
jgi:WD40 repeat protein